MVTGAPAASTAGLDGSVEGEGDTGVGSGTKETLVSPEALQWGDREETAASAQTRRRVVKGS